MLVAAARFDVPVVAPGPGGSVEPATLAPGAASQRWWPDVPWKTALDEPCVSSHLEPCLLEALAAR